ncbi:MAG: HesA/MoeB/ThiF family protein [Alphaproteobacteria bacterium]|nr:HesA/MoeB/ThiF family protein [Alphaproteobacteria bacterium]
MLTSQHRIRYSRQLLLGDIGEAGQQTLLNASVLVIGAGGLGSPLLLYLSAAGVGNIGIVDDDLVDPSNLQRQILYTESDIGLAKSPQAKAHLSALNSGITIHTYQERLTSDNAAAIFAQYDIIADGSDNFETRFLVNQTCIQTKKPLIAAAVQGWQGQLYVVRGYLPDQPCYACLYPSALVGQDLSCSQIGVVGAACGVLGSLQATEIIRMILGHHPDHSGTMLIVDLQKGLFRRTHISIDSNCSCTF